MLIFAIDDERLSLETLRRALCQAAPEAEVRAFSRSQDALAAIADEGLRPAAIFSDIEMPGMSGLALAVELKTLVPNAGLVFVTGYTEYALDAYRAHVRGYVMKPVTAERLREELEALRLPVAEVLPNRRLQVRCFGAFEVFWRGQPLVFSRTQTRELLAFLVDREGAACTAGEIIAALWEGTGELSGRKAYLRTLTSDLHAALAAIGMEQVLIRAHRQWAVRRDLLDCDYYRMLEGDSAAINAFRGEYMTQYAWAELTAARLSFRDGR